MEPGCCSAQHANWGSQGSIDSTLAIRISTKLFFRIVNLSGKKILFIFHNTGLTGASIVLLRYIEFFKRHHPGVTVICLIPGAGKIESRLRRLGTVEYFGVQRKISLAERIKRKLGLRVKGVDRVKRVAELAAQFKADLVYCNTVACAEYIPAIKNVTTAPVVLHIHELRKGIELLNIDPREWILLADMVIANSAATAEFLRQYCSIDSSRIVVCYPSLSAHNLVHYPEGGKTVIGSAGTALPTKGAIGFIELAYEMRSLTPGRHYEFIWIGNCSKYKTEIEQAISKYAVNEIVHFVGEKENVLEEFRKFTVFVSLSDEESFGLALAEAGSVGVPVAAYEGAGEISQLVASCKGVHVPHHHVKEMAKALTALTESVPQMEECGKTAQEHCRRYFDEMIVPQWIGILEDMIRLKTS